MNKFGPDVKIRCTLVEPRSGFLNVLGMPKCLVDPRFAQLQYISFDSIVPFDFKNVLSMDNSVIEKYTSETTDRNLEVNFVHGKVVKLESSYVEFVYEDSMQPMKIDFDIVVLATGCNRNEPMTPAVLNKREFLSVADEFRKKVEELNIVSVVGAGAVGIELACEIKEYYPQKRVQLIHPHDSLPPDNLGNNFKSVTKECLKKLGILLILNTRISKELENGKLMSTDGREIESEFNYWSNYRHNNIGFLSEDFKDKFVNDRGNILVNEYLQPQNNGICENKIFCVGDLIEIPVIKSAGYALHEGVMVGLNVFELVLGNSMRETLTKNKLSLKMILYCGLSSLISEIGGNVELNNPLLKKDYEDFCLRKALNVMRQSRK